MQPSLPEEKTKPSQVRSLNKKYTATIFQCQIYMYILKNRISMYGKKRNRIIGIVIKWLNSSWPDLIVKIQCSSSKDETILSTCCPWPQKLNAVPFGTILTCRNPFMLSDITSNFHSRKRKIIDAINSIKLGPNSKHSRMIIIYFWWKHKKYDHLLLLSFFRL